MPLNDPERLTDAGGSDRLAEAIRALQAEPANAAALARLRERMASALPGPAVSQPVAAARTAATTAWRVGFAAIALALGYWLGSQLGPIRVDPPKQSRKVDRPLPAASVPVEPALDSTPATLPPSSAARPLARDVRPAHTRPRRAPAPPQPEAELTLLQQAQAALSSDPALALARSEEHLRLYPRGVFSEEREMLAIEALQKLKRKAAARQRASAFVERFPLSPHARRVRALLDATPTAASD